MITLITGGAASGKSEYGEEQARFLSRLHGGAPLFYLATMEPLDQECLQRIARHRRAREGKGFATLECPRDLAGATRTLPREGVALLECLSNLLANEMYRTQSASKPWSTPEGAVALEERLLGEIFALSGRVRELVIISNQVFSDGCTYDPETQQYLRLLGGLHQRLAAQAESVVELVFTLPAVQKWGRLWQEEGRG